MISTLLAIVAVGTIGCQGSTRILSYGDSKTLVTGLGPGTNLDAWQMHLTKLVGNPCRIFDVGTPISNGALARGSNTAAQMKALVDADLATIGATPTYILMNLGSVELALGMPVEAQFETDYGYILDAFHTKWPNVKVYCHRPWYANHEADSNLIAGYIAVVLSTRGSFAYVGPDERVWAKGSDNGATMTSDGLHYSYAGAIKAAAQWRSVLGL